MAGLYWKLIVAALALGAPASAGILLSGAWGAVQQTNPTAETQVKFLERVKAYMDLRQKLEAPLPKLGKEASPTELDLHQRQVGALVKEARKTAQRGDIFGPEMEALVRTLMARVFKGPDGQKAMASIMEENPMTLVLKVNDRYPDTVPLSTMPPDILSSLPTLPAEELEYRFVGDRLILLDVKAHVIADFIDNILPKR
jgi:hypothetical protein